MAWFIKQATNFSHKLASSKHALVWIMMVILKERVNEINKRIKSTQPFCVYFLCVSTEQDLFRRKCLRMVRSYGIIPTTYNTKTITKETGAALRGTYVEIDLVKCFNIAYL